MQARLRVVGLEPRMCGKGVGKRKKSGLEPPCGEALNDGLKEVEFRRQRIH